MNRRLAALSAAAAAFALALVPVLPATATTAAEPPTPTWSVQPSSPTRIDGRAAFAYAVNPGTEIDDVVSVSNLGSTPETFDVYGTDAITQYDTGAFGLLTAAQKPKDIGTWITTKTNKVTVQPGETAFVPFQLIVPSDATPGDHTGGVIASVTSVAPGKKGAPGLGVDQRVAARIYLRVAGQPVARVAATGLVVGFSPSLNPFGTGDATVDFDVRNTGNVRENVAQKSTLSGPFGIKLGAAASDAVTNLLPGQSTHIHEKISGVFPLALLFADVRLTPSAPTDLVGQSKLRDQTGKLVPPLTQPRFTAVTSSALTVAITWTLLLLVLLVIGLVFLVVRYVRTTRERMFDAIDAATEQARREAAQRDAVTGKQTVDAGAPGSRS